MADFAKVDTRSVAVVLLCVKDHYSEARKSYRNEYQDASQTESQGSQCDGIEIHMGIDAFSDHLLARRIQSSFRLGSRR